jgi:beta-lactamase class A
MRAGRRETLAGLLALAAAPAFAASTPFDDIESTLGDGRMGFAAVDLRTGRRWAHRAQERFALCSTFKLPLVAAILASVEGKQLDPGQRLAIASEAANVLAPTMKALLPDGSASVIDLCVAAMVHSDNAAANLLLPLVDGPPGLTRFMQQHGRGSMRLDRNEPTLNTNLPGDPRDTTTPADILALMREVLTGQVLGSPMLARLTGWMIASGTGAQRLRGGLPPQWRAGDKTGTGERGAANDVAIVWPTGASLPVLIAAYVDAPHATAAVRNAAHRAIAGRIAAELP